MQSQTLNTISQLLNEAYQNTRNQLSAFRAQAEEKLHAFKKAKNFTALKQNTVFNQTSLYTDLYRVTEMVIYYLKQKMNYQTRHPKVY